MGIWEQLRSMLRRRSRSSNSPQLQRHTDQVSLSCIDFFDRNFYLHSSKMGPLGSCRAHHSCDSKLQCGLHCCAQAPAGPFCHTDFEAAGAATYHERAHRPLLQAIKITLDEKAASAATETGSTSMSIDSSPTALVEALFETPLDQSAHRQLTQQLTQGLPCSRQEQQLEDASLAKELALHKSMLRDAEVQHAALTEELDECKTKLREASSQAEKATELANQLDKRDLLCQGLESELANSSCELKSLKAEHHALTDKLMASEGQASRLQATISELEVELERLECDAGKDLLTYRGSNQSHASLSVLRRVLKKLSTLASVAAATIVQQAWTLPLIPLMIDLDVVEATSKWVPLRQAALTHLLLRTAVDSACTFSQQHLLISTAPGMTDMYSLDDSQLCCQLKVEKQRSEAWLKQLQGSSTVADLPDAARPVVNEVLQHSFQALEKAYGKSVGRWRFADREQAVGCWQPLLEPLVLKSLLAQAITSVMHPRLLQLVVPGWLSSSSAVLATGVAAPDAWAMWPGVLVFDSKVMDRGGGSTAATGVLEASDNTPAAVFCGEVGVVQLAGGMRELDGCGVQPSGQMAAGDPCQGAVLPVKVLKKPRVFVAFTDAT